MANVQVTFKKRNYTVNMENADELYICSLKEQYEKIYNEVEQESTEGDTYSNFFLTGLRLVNDIMQLKERIKKLENRALPVDTSFETRIDSMLSKLDAVFEK